ncbi:MAG: hypothetical protein GXP55_22950, partial [Deltaproteobacteria bacterium]|nr:hypothetical protein [Deltaproteobacteria bacterium]
PVQAEEEESPPDFTGAFHGEYRFRTMVMSDIPLTPFESKGFAPRLGQNFWGSQWLRAGFHVAYRERFRLVVEATALDGVVFGDATNGVQEAERPRDGVTATRGDAFDLRKAYLEWQSSVGVLRAGLQPSHWGLGLLANAGDEAPSFGDYVEGDRDLRLLFATRPFGADVPFEAIFAGDLVYDDVIARLRSGDRAYQGILALRYRSEEEGTKREAGFYGVYRHQAMPVDAGALAANLPADTLDVWALDLYGNWDFAGPSGGRLFAAFEGVAIFGDTTITRSLDRAKEDIRQYLGAIQLGRRGDSLDITFEGGFTSGDSNTEDGVQRRATMNRNHRVGLVLFPQVMAWNTARAATLAASEELGARPAPGSRLLPTNGGLAGAFYLNPHVRYRPTDWLDLRAGMVWGRASSAVVDPYRQRAESRTANYQGGDARQRDLGLEVDGSVLLSYNLPEGVVLTGGVEGGWFQPGRAFDDAAGNAMSPVGLVRLRAGLAF